MVLLDFLNISTLVVKDDYSPRKLLKNETKQKIGKITFLVFLCTCYIYITYIKWFAESNIYIYYRTWKESILLRVVIKWKGAFSNGIENA